jgi:hypothetical protein
MAQGPQARLRQLENHGLGFEPYFFSIHSKRRKKVPSPSTIRTVRPLSTKGAVSQSFDPHGKHHCVHTHKMMYLPVDESKNNTLHLHFATLSSPPPPARTLRRRRRAAVQLSEEGRWLGGRYIPVSFWSLYEVLSWVMNHSADITL